MNIMVTIRNQNKKKINNNFIRQRHNRVDYYYIKVSQCFRNMWRFQDERCLLLYGHSLQKNLGSLLHSYFSCRTRVPLFMYILKQLLHAYGPGNFKFR